MGDVLTFNGRLTALGGEYTAEVEVYEGGIWNNQMINPIGSKDNINTREAHYHFTSLAIKIHLYVFGNI